MMDPETHASVPCPGRPVKAASAKMALDEPAMTVSSASSSNCMMLIVAAVAVAVAAAVDHFHPLYSDQRCDNPESPST